MELSKSHFNPNDVAFKESQFLTYDILDASDYSTGLLGRASDSNPDGLNQRRDESFDTGNGSSANLGLDRIVSVASPVLDVVYPPTLVLVIISLAMVVTAETVDSDNNSVSISQERLKVFAETQGKKLNSYMRDNFPEISRNLPILITVYCLSDDATLPGNFIQQAYFTSNSANFTDIDEEWLLLPSDDFEELDADVSSQFSTLKSGLSGVSPDDVFIVGKGRFVSDALAELDITVNLHAKTGAEAIALAQYIYGQTSLFTSTNYEISIDISSDNDHVAVIKRSAGSGDAQITMLI